jgi:hypothetical protein
VVFTSLSWLAPLGWEGSNATVYLPCLPAPISVKVAAARAGAIAQEVEFKPQQCLKKKKKKKKKIHKFQGAGGAQL